MDVQWGSVQPEGVWHQILTHKIVMGEPIGRSTDGHCLRCRQPLELSSKVRRFTQGQPFVPVPTTHFSHHDQTGMNPYTHSEPHTTLVFQAGIQCPHSLN